MADLSIVFSTGDLAELAVAKLLLDAEGVPYVVQGEGVQNLFGLGSLTGFNPLTGPVEVRVADHDLQWAREALADLRPEGK